MKQGTYERTDAIKDKLRLNLKLRRDNGELFGFVASSVPIEPRVCVDCGITVWKTSVRCRLCMGISMRGANHPRWNGGSSSEAALIRQSREYKAWRKSVFARDNYTCVLCGARCGNGVDVVLNADHIKSFAKFPELRFDIDNGRTLCYPCHKDTDSYGWKGTP